MILITHFTGYFSFLDYEENGKFEYIKHLKQVQVWCLVFISVYGEIPHYITNHRNIDSFMGMCNVVVQISSLLCFVQSICFHTNILIKRIFILTSSV